MDLRRHLLQSDHLMNGGEKEVKGVVWLAQVHELEIELMSFLHGSLFLPIHNTVFSLKK